MLIDKYSARELLFDDTLLSKSGKFICVSEPDFSLPVILPVRYFRRDDLTVLCAPRKIADKIDIENFNTGDIYPLCFDYAASCGFTPDKSFDLCNRYMAKSDTLSAPSVSAVRLTGSESYTLLSDIEGQINDGRAVFGVLSCGTVVSACGAFVDKNVCQLWTETAPAYRKRGYASSCALACAKHYLDRGFCVIYDCKKKNTASVHTALKSGFIPHSEFATFVARK